MVSHWGVGLFKSHARSDHSIGTNKERYLEQNIPELTFPGAYALNGWVDATTKKYRPKFHCLGPHMTEQAHYLIKEFYIVVVPQFK